MSADELRKFLIARVEENDVLDDYHEKQPTIRYYQQADEAMLRQLATMYSSHPDYRDEWRP